MIAPCIPLLKPGLRSPPPPPPGLHSPGRRPGDDRRRFFPAAAPDAAAVGGWGDWESGSLGRGRCEGRHGVGGARPCRRLLLLSTWRFETNEFIVFIYERGRFNKRSDFVCTMANSCTKLNGADDGLGSTPRAAASHAWQARNGAILCSKSRKRNHLAQVVVAATLLSTRRAQGSLSSKVSSRNLEIS
jgi:hypothetical protein